MFVKSLKLVGFTLIFLSAACSLTSALPNAATPLVATAAAIPAETLAALPTSPLYTATPAAFPTTIPTENPYPWSDQIPTMYGICFEAALDAADQVFVLRSAEDHIRFYDLADNSGLCRRPVTRNPFAFNDGEQVLAGLWNAGTGCTARHEVLDWSITDGTLNLTLRFITEGDCNYELVRPYWIGVPDVTDVQIDVVP